MRLGLAGLAMASALVAACTDLDDIPKHVRPLPDAVELDLENKGMREGDPILIRIFKEESELEVWKKRRSTGRFALFKKYDICKWSGKLGPKIKEGDRQAPEGFYTVAPGQMNPRSSYHLAFNIGFPNAFDRAHERTGSHLMVHGACSSRGCYSMEDEQIQEIYTLGRLAFQSGQRAFQVQAYPFRMTPENMARHRNDPHYEFWQMLKVGHDHFEVTRQQPRIEICEKRYQFNVAASDSFNSTGACPADMAVPPSIKTAVDSKTAKDRAAELVIASRLQVEQEKEQAKLAAAAEKERARKEREAARVAAAEQRRKEREAKKQVASAPQDQVVVEGGPKRKPGTALAYGASSDDAEDGNAVTRLWKRLF